MPHTCREWLSCVIKVSPPKTVVNTHRMLHRAWEDFEKWSWAKRNVVNDARPPRVPRKGRKVWTVGQLQIFPQYARRDRFFGRGLTSHAGGSTSCLPVNPARILAPRSGG